MALGKIGEPVACALTSENYNVLFLEILLWLAGPPSRPNGQDSRALRDWLTSEDSIQANLIMHNLCRRAFIASHESRLQEDLYRPAPFHVSARAQVWRHWYSTLNQMLASMPHAIRSDITVTPLPGNISVAGEWFLGVPRYAASPDVGLRLIQLYTTQEAEIDRIRYGVGLPVRKSFYAQGSNTTASISPLFSMDTSLLLQVIEGAFRRSSFSCYQRYSSVLSMHLQDVLMLHSTDKQQLEQRIRAKANALRQRLAFVASGEDTRHRTSRNQRPA